MGRGGYVWRNDKPMKHPLAKAWTTGIAFGLVAATMLLTTGCETVVGPKQRVGVDAICAVGATKPTGRTFRLLEKRTVKAGQPVKSEILAACVGAALVREGMAEAAAGAAADLMIEMNFGVYGGLRADPMMLDTTLELSARSNAERALDLSTESEVWNVRASIQGLRGRMENALPLLASVAAGAAATDTKILTKMEVAENAPEVIAVRDAAVKTLEARAMARGESAANASAALRAVP